MVKVEIVFGGCYGFVIVIRLSGLLCGFVVLFLCEGGWWVVD